MWISNAATALMMLPIALALIQEIKDAQFQTSICKFSKAPTTVAYSASIGGLATLLVQYPMQSLLPLHHRLDRHIRAMDDFRSAINSYFISNSLLLLTNGYLKLKMLTKYPQILPRKLCMI